MADSDSDSEEEILDITTPEVLAKYRLSAEIANREHFALLVRFSHCCTVRHPQEHRGEMHRGNKHS